MYRYVLYSYMSNAGAVLGYTCVLFGGMRLRVILTLCEARFKTIEGNIICHVLHM